MTFHRVSRIEIAVLTLIIAIAVGFRLYGLAWAPPGMHVTEAANGIRGLQGWQSGPGSLFINLQSVAVDAMGTTAVALRMVSVISGVLTVLGVYVLTRRIFSNWEIAAISAFVMAIGCWHVAFSRIGSGAILAPLCAVWGLYYLYSGLLTTRIWPWLMAGMWFGVGFYTSYAFRFMPAAIIVTIVGYLYAVHHSFSHDKYAHIRQQLIGGMALMIAVMVVIIVPMLSYLYVPDAPTDPLWHALAGQPLLVWPMMVLGAVGLLRSCYKIVRTTGTHGHPSVVHVLLLSWFGVALIPPATLLAAPIVYIFVGQGIWWLYVWFFHWFSQRDSLQVCLPGPHGHRYCTGEGTLVVTITLVAFLFALGVVEGERYFVQWTQHPIVREEFSPEATAIATRLNELPTATLKYVVYRDSRQIQAIMFLTDTATPERQQAKHISYLTVSEFNQHRYPKGSVIITLAQ